MDLAFMSHLFFFTAFLFYFFVSSYGQKRWSGGGGDGQWNNPQNWVGNTLPVSTDDVILDNSQVSTDYTVKLPSGNLAVKVKTIAISPGSGDSIMLLLPNTNTAVPAFTATGPGYGMILNARATFKNSSGAASGTPVSIADSIRIKTGGKWVHNTARGHSANVQVLSAVIGTDKGIFEFDAPNASTTLSLSGQIFGTLVFRSTGAGGSLTYTGVGTSKVRIRGDLEINAGVNLSLNFSDSIVVSGEYIQKGGTCNLGNSTRSVVLVINKGITQAAGSIITESGTNIQQILIKGGLPHPIDIKGSIQNQVAFTLDATAPADLLSPLVLPYLLTLRNGVINSSTSALLTLSSTCSIKADTLSGNSYVFGPMKKMGLIASDFLFPVGESGLMHWMRLKNATGDYTVNYNRIDPHSLGNTIGSGINHISGLEYWTINAVSPASGATVILSFNDPHSGGVTSLSTLRVARFMNGSWEDAGNTAYAGSAGSNGWVSSVAASGFSADNTYFALASSVGQENPLPLSSLILHASKTNRQIHFYWDVSGTEGLKYFELERSDDNVHFSLVSGQHVTSNINRYVYTLLQETPTDAYYRVRVTAADGSVSYSRIVRIPGDPKTFLLSGNNIIHDVLHLHIVSQRNERVLLILSNAHGTIMKKIETDVKQGKGVAEISFEGLPPGLYQLFGLSSGGRTNLFRCLKL